MEKLPVQTSEENWLWKRHFFLVNVQLIGVIKVKDTVNSAVAIAIAIGEGLILEVEVGGRCSTLVISGKRHVMHVLRVNVGTEEAANSDLPKVSDVVGSARIIGQEIIAVVGERTLTGMAVIRRIR